jgi:Ecdysteroid kinase-like family
VEELIFPMNPQDFTPEFMSRAVSREFPGSAVAAVHVVESKRYGDEMASTAGRVVLDLTYTPGSKRDLPARVVVKVSRSEATPEHNVLYSNEVNFYRRIRPQLVMETPISLGGNFDKKTLAFGQILDDLRLRNAQMMNVLVPHSLDQVRAVLDTLAVLHSAFWESPRFSSDLKWVDAQDSGEIHDAFTNPNRVPAHIKATTERWLWKQEMVQRLGVTLEDLRIQMARVKRHHGSLPQTLLHGDMHVGNTYQVDHLGGLLDWQLMSRGHFSHDVSYYIHTSLSVENRRKHERDLLKYYLEKLKQLGVPTVPSFDSAWLAYRQCAAWNVYIGWLTTEVQNYGWEICVMAHLRVMTAYEDLEAAKAIAGLP